MYILATVIFLTVILNYFLAKAGNPHKAEDLEEEERKANAARRRDLPPGMFIAPEAEKLPFSDNLKEDKARLARAQENARRLIGEKMVKLQPEMSNNDLKYAYGVARLDELISFDENRERFVKALIAWAQELMKYDMNAEARAVLEESLHMKSDYGKSYTLLYDVYLSLGDEEAAEKLKADVGAEGFLRHLPSLREKIREYMENGSKAEEGGE
ncbi:MAG: hypothetical protein LBU36_03850 [Clostridiales bacterium]|nr:hypothetical protein [Clostridiales bacterium]